LNILANLDGETPFSVLLPYNPLAFLDGLLL
jgi:hypothetical protein